MKNPGPRVEPRPPGVLLMSQTADAFPPIVPTKTTTGRRKAFAAWLTRPDNPLTARVIVNRLWQHHFGKGIVATPSDFGVRGEAPTHPELLDWLATELIAGGWKLKPIHRLTVTSASYRQASIAPPTSPNRKRPTIPRVLALSDEPATDGSGITPRRHARRFRRIEFQGGWTGGARADREGDRRPDLHRARGRRLWSETPDPAEHLRRSLYIFRKRNVRYPMFDAFDAPDTQSACPERGVSTHAFQALVMLNSDFAAARAKALAGRLYREIPEGMDARDYSCLPGCPLPRTASGRIVQGATLSIIADFAHLQTARRRPTRGRADIHESWRRSRRRGRRGLISRSR